MSSDSKTPPRPFGCYECGSPHGSTTILCPKCEARAYAAAQSAEDDTGSSRGSHEEPQRPPRGTVRPEAVKPTPDEDDSLLAQLGSISPLGRIITLSIVVIEIGVAFFVASSMAVSASSVILMITAALTAGVALIAFGVMVAIVWGGDPRLALATLLAFPLIYYLSVTAYREETPLWSALRAPLIAHLVGAALCLATVATAWTLDISLLPVRKVAEQPSISTPVPALSEFSGYDY